MSTAGSEPRPARQEDPCRTREVLDIVGDKWSLLVVRNLSQGPRRFTELKRAIDGISQRMLTVTLRSLERDGVSRGPSTTSCRRTSATNSPRWSRPSAKPPHPCWSGALCTWRTSTRPAPRTTPALEKLRRRSPYDRPIRCRDISS
jgi:hypothetical protein